MAPRWSAKRTLKFLGEYKKRECLWNQFNYSHENRMAREKALEEIVYRMNIKNFGVSETKAKIKSLRATFSSVLTKVEKSELSGSGSASGYVPTLKWFNLMKELVEKGSIKRGRISKLGRQLNIADIKEKCVGLDDQMEELVGQEDLHNEYEENQQHSDQEMIYDQTEMPPKKFKAMSQFSRVNSTDEEIMTANGCQYAYPPTCSGTVNSIDDECDVFGKHVAAQLKKLSPEQVIVVQGNIQAILTQSRLAVLYDSYTTPAIRSLESYDSTDQYCNSP